MASLTLLAVSTPLHKEKTEGPEPEMPEPKAPAFSASFGVSTKKTAPLQPGHF